MERQTALPALICVGLNRVQTLQRLLQQLFDQTYAHGAGPHDFLPDNLGTYYQLIDARFDLHTRYASVFQMKPAVRLIFSGLYSLAKVETPLGRAYLDLMRRASREGQLAESNLSSKQPADPLSIFEATLADLVLYDGVVVRSAMLDDVTRISAEQNYVRVHLRNRETLLMRGPLRKWCDALPTRFLRISRQLIVNLSHVRQLQRVSPNQALVSVEADDQPIPVGRKAALCLRRSLLARGNSALAPHT